MGLKKVGAQYFKISQEVTRGVLPAKFNVFIRHCKGNNAALHIQLDMSLDIGTMFIL